MNGSEMAAALGLSPAMVSKLRKRGMPMDTVERAERWRKRHLNHLRSKGVRIDTPRPPAMMTVRRQAPAVGRAPTPDALDSFAELRSLVAGHSPNEALPADVVLEVRQVLRRVPFPEFRRLYDDGIGSDLVWRVVPEALATWDNWEPEGAEEDWYEPIPDVDLPLLHLVVGGAAVFEFDPGAVAAEGPRPAFRSCVRLAAN
jgi:hypothetical protein